MAEQFAVLGLQLTASVYWWLSWE